MELKWIDDYSIGNDQLDEQHKHWVGLYSRLEKLMNSGTSEELGVTKAEVLKEMTEYVDYHFRFEEKYMEDIGYPQAKKHWRQHKDFRNTIYAIYRDYSGGNIVLNTEIMNMIKNWLVDHILGEDMKFMAYHNQGRK